MIRLIMDSLRKILKFEPNLKKNIYEKDFKFNEEITTPISLQFYFFCLSKRAEKNHYSIQSIRKLYKMDGK